MTSNSAAAVRVRDLAKGYRLGREHLPVLRAVDFHADPGEMVVIMGPSGSGKTTLLNCISAIDKPDSGEVQVAGQAVDFTSELAQTQLRRHHIGMVFQFFNLIPTLTVRENIALPFLVAATHNQRTQSAVEAILSRVGMEHRARHYPHQLSGGEMQLTSIARALVHRPGLLLADEPTGNVNPSAGRTIMDILRDAAKAQQAGIVMVTHSPEYAAWADRICFLKDGVIAGEYSQGGDTSSVAPIYDQLLALNI